jgi:hypothetical protein
MFSLVAEANELGASFDGPLALGWAGSALDGAAEATSALGAEGATLDAGAVTGGVFVAAASRLPSLLLQTPDPRRTELSSPPRSPSTPKAILPAAADRVPRPRSSTEREKDNPADEACAR